MRSHPKHSHRSKGRGRPLPFSSWLASDRGLLAAFLASAFIVSISFVVLPWTLDSQDNNVSAPAFLKYHSVTKTSEKESELKKQVSNQTSVRAGSSRTGRRNKKADTVSHMKTIDKKITSNESPFLTQSTAYHTIFSTGCSIFQDWQSYIFFYHVFRSGQEGHVTRIASGCNDEDAKKLQDMFASEIESMRPDTHHLHLTPEYKNIPKKHKNPFKYFNKPFGVRHWMEHALGYPKNHELHDDSIIILLDPDQVMLRPFTNDFTNSSEIWRSANKRKLKVEHGSPFAQQYGYGIQWKNKVDYANIFKGDNWPTPASNLTRQEVNSHYVAMGPPYIATAKDMWRIVNKWTEIAPLVHDEYPHLLAEMFAYNLAVAHLGLRHTIAQSFHVSDPWAGGEGWELIDAVPKDKICKDFPKSELPHVLHYCQRYYLGKWYIGKYRLRKDFISCRAPLLTYPPDDLASKYTSSILPGQNEVKEIRPKQSKEYAFMVCAMIDALNAASKFYKDNHCKDGSANYDYSYTFHSDMRMPNETKEIAT